MGGGRRWSVRERRRRSWCGKGEKREGKWLEGRTREFRERVKEESRN